MGQFVPDFPLAQVQPAAYNPRLIDADTFAELCRSVRELGLVKPVLVNAQNNVLVAGHQRTRAMRETGAMSVPAMVLDRVPAAQEMRFNQLHNAADTNFAEVPLVVSGLGREPGYRWAKTSDIHLDVKPSEVKGANFRHSIMMMMMRFGDWGSAVCAPDGKVVVSKQYAICALILRRPLLVCVVPEEKVSRCQVFFGRDYGTYDYSDKTDKNFNQAYCQFGRLVAEEHTDKKVRTSPLYERHLIPIIRRGMSILDFGAGRKEYARKLTAMGHDVTPIEFYERIPGTTNLNTDGLARDLQALCHRLKTRGRFDLVLADVVISSCNTQEREDDLLHALNALCRLGGTLACSGRQIEVVQSREKARRMVTTKTARRAVEFLDKNNISAIYKQGVWIFQKFHDDGQRRRIANRFVGPRHRLTTLKGCFQISGEKGHEMPEADAERALRRQFDLPLPSGKTVGFGDAIVDAWRCARALEKKAAS